MGVGCDDIDGCVVVISVYVDDGVIIGCNVAGVEGDR